MKIAFAIRAVRDDEAELRDELDRAGDRHRADHDVFHMTRTLITLHHDNLQTLAPFAERYPTDGPPVRAHEVSRPPEPGLLLLHDLRHLHLLYAAASVDWVLLGQGAQAIRDAELLDAVSTCHAQTLRGMKWTLTRLKAAAPQALAG